ncbi:MAG: NADH-quinone oxidoreductase subunit G [Burkholderiales bacterium]|nr:NADH-quinone oxidoreductase subunit G [Burkholderiales bacterium]
MLEIELNGKKLEVAEGSTIMDAANGEGIYIPHFCYHRKLSIAANCRMCLVQVEKAPKPLPACATPVTNGMKVWTHSDTAVDAQKGVMEFLLINHPLDCPICDQGGECQLQDLAVGYGASASQYDQAKRVVPNKDLGPLIATDMTRCIHCTRCVRFGQEIAGIMELGMIGRGEHSEIITFVGRTVDSELSGNVIDLCPVGALTSKPFRYSARTWELMRRPSISPHCGLGSNLTVQVKQNRVMRVLPRENEAINECWLSDKDRFSYEGLNSAQRLARPMIRSDGTWREVDWQTALDAAVAGLRRVRDAHGAAAIGALATAHATLEELYLLQKLMRALGSGNVDHRLRQSDFSRDGAMAGAPWLGHGIADLATLDRVLVVGSTLRKDHPLIAHRLRQAAKKALQVNVVNPVDDDLLMRVAHRLIVAPSRLPRALAEILKAVCEAKGLPVPAPCAALEVSEAAQRIAESLASGESVGLYLGNQAQHHPRAGLLHALVQAIATALGARFGFLGEAANSVGAVLAGAVPYVGAVTGLDARAMLATPRQAYVLLHAEPELDCHDGAAAMAAMKAAQFVVAMSAYQHAATEYAHVLLPIAPFTETSGTFVNTEGRVQSFRGVVNPLGETRPGWKVLRVLGTNMGLAGFDYLSSEQVRSDALGDPSALAERLDNRLANASIDDFGAEAPALERIGEIHSYHADAIVRRAPALAATREGESPVASMNAATLNRLGLRAGTPVRLRQGSGEASVPLVLDDRLPADCVRIGAGHPATASLGPLFGPIEASAAAVEARKAG